MYSRPTRHKAWRVNKMAGKQARLVQMNESRGA
jgi:hypothetical protein